MKRRGIKNLIIDFGGVLIDLDRQRCLENFRKLGLPDVEVMLDLYHQQDFFQKYEKGLITSAEFREVNRGKIGKPVTDAQIDDAWNSFLVSIPTFKLDLLLELRKKYVVYLLSNTNEIHWQWSCLHAFRYKAFRAGTFLDETGILPNETLFIDDSEANCRTAEALGISTYTPKAHEDWRHAVVL